MITLTIKNIIIGLIVILINIIPLVLRKYKLVPIAALISLILMLVANYLS